MAEDLDDFDQLLESALTSPVHGSAGTAAVADNNQQQQQKKTLEDDLFDFLDNAGSSNAAAGSATAPAATTSAAAEDDDFMSWLEETAVPTVTPAATAVTAAAETVTVAAAATDATATVATPDKSVDPETQTLTAEVGSAILVSPNSSFLSQTSRPDEAIAAVEKVVVAEEVEERVVVEDEVEEETTREEAKEVVAKVTEEVVEMEVVGEVSTEDSTTQAVAATAEESTFTEVAVEEAITTAVVEAAAEDVKAVAIESCSSKSSPSQKSSAAMADFFEDVFGTDDVSAAVAGFGSSSNSSGGDIASSPTAAAVAASSKTSAVLNASSQLRSEYEQELKTIIHSSFPDLDRLRALVFELGYVPAAIRAQIWALLLTGNCTEDEEAWSFSAEEGAALDEQQQLADDCSAIVRNYNATVAAVASSTEAGKLDDDDDFLFGPSRNSAEKASSSSNSQMMKDMSDILTLFCLRRSAEYSSVYCQLLSPLLVTPLPSSRAMASASFYALATEFVPLVGLQSSSTAYAVATESVHSWLRLLVSYHAPALVQHLDRVLPRWELPTKQLTASEAEKYATDLKRNTDLDELERELGLDLLDSSIGSSSHRSVHSPLDVTTATAATTTTTGTTSTSATTASAAIESAPPVRRSTAAAAAALGCVPAHWIAAMFAGSLPPSYAAHLLDWAIINRIKFAGVFFTAALLAIYSDSLLAMNATQVRQWFDEVAANKADWFKIIPVSVPKTTLQLQQQQQQRTPACWEAFIRGWIHATAALINSTPRAFRDALQRTEEWAILKANLLQEAAADGANDDALELAAAAAVASAAAEDAAAAAGTTCTAAGDKYDNDVLYPRVRQVPQQSAAAGTVSGASLAQLSFEGDEGPDAIFRDLDGGNGSSGVDDDDDDHDEETFTFESSEGRLGGAFGGTSAGLLAGFRKLKQKFGSLAGDGAALRSARNNPQLLLLRNYAQSQRTYEKSLCLWASADEVLPCICSNRRRPACPDDIYQRFHSCTFHPLTTSADRISAAVAAAIEAAAAAASQSAVGVVPLCFPLNFQPVDADAAAAGYSGSRSSIEAMKLRDEQLPFFFGLDCRTPDEKTLGQFPKAYGIDPADLADSEEIVRLLDVIEPLAATVHICLIGAGADYHRWKFERSNAMKIRERLRNSIVGSGGNSNSNSSGHGNSGHGSISNIHNGGFSTTAAPSLLPDHPEVAAAIQEHDNRLNSVVMFFQKRGFPHVSILDGGFVTAARYLHSAHSQLTLGAALVDSDRKALESLLGLPPSLLPPSHQQHQHQHIASIVTKFESVGPAAIASVGNFFNTLGKSAQQQQPPQQQQGVSGDIESKKPAAAQVSATAATATSAPVAASSAVSGEAGGGAAGAKQLFSAWGKKISMFSAASVDTIKKGVATYAERMAAQHDATATPGGAAVNSTEAAKQQPLKGAVMEFDADVGTRQEIADTTGISISRTDKERAVALAIHKMAGLKKGDRVKINRQELPGAILFPSIKYKDLKVSWGTSKQVATDSTRVDISSSSDEIATIGTENSADTAAGGTPAIAAAAVSMSEAVQQVQVHRYLVVSRERFLVLDADGGGVGSEAIVKSNRHLTELTKMTFKKKDPELVTLFYLAPDGETLRSSLYRVSKRKEFVEALQKNMERFK